MLALFVIWAMVKTVADVYNFGSKHVVLNRKWINIVLVVTLIQMVFAGLMAGMRAGLYYPTWPNMNGEFIPQVLLNSDNWTWANLINYDSYLFAPAFVQFTHRILAYLLLVLTIYMFLKLKDTIEFKSKIWLNSVIVLIFVQVVLGILTVLNVNGKIPLFFGVTHQLVGLLFFMNLLFLNYKTRN